MKAECSSLLREIPFLIHEDDESTLPLKLATRPDISAILGSLRALHLTHISDVERRSNIRISGLFCQADSLYRCPKSSKDMVLTRLE